ncbi:ATP-NAD kinase family protein [Parahaliea aestuarii]|uniref:ATP-NAD kinase n=1 Tax=Parahaliea aestuarii TaxID=1852021 RepID=A0A5C8ZT89_9GAMM|nr:ATP-NAD kinase family protein [Parahaliea aestuarii]TXS90989.1 ATP-NAD kinase [Parahaliea aestuarii]
MSRLRIGLLINPLAGVGGSLAMKGSDGEMIRERIAREGASLRSAERARRALSLLCAPGLQLSFVTWGGAMGQTVLEELGFAPAVLGRAEREPSSAADSRRAAAELSQACDLLVFVGGDGTARDVYDAVGEQQPVLGIPAGVKMHSAVFAVSPEAAGELLLQLARGGLVGLRRQEVRDIDETAFREGRVRTRFYGEMMVPGEGRFLQHTKVGGREDQVLVAADIAAWLAPELDPHTLYLLGPGSTTAALLEALGLPATLLGVDALRGGEILAADADESGLLALLAGHDGPAQIIVTAIGGQGHIFGRGNQQLSPLVIRAVGRQNIRLIAAKSKIAALEGRPLLVDTNDPALDRELEGYYPVTTGYEDEILYRVAAST